MKLAETTKSKLTDAVRPGIKVKIELITPDIALKYLKENVGHNRKMNRRHVEWIADQMERNKWLTTHQAIAFDADGVLIDGQHRLNALVKSVTSHWFVVVRGVDSAAFAVFDTGKIRSAVDVLTTEGYIEYPNHISAAARFALNMEGGRYTQDSSRNTKVTNMMILERVRKDHDQLHRLSSHYSTLVKRYGQLIPVAQKVGLIHLISKMKDCDEQTGVKFFDDIYTGVGLGPHDVQLFLRDWLFKIKTMDRKPPNKVRLATVINGWNLFRDDRPINRMFTWKSDQTFPKLK